MQTVALFTAAFIGVVALFLGVDWLLWKGWLTMMEYFWPTGPEHIVRPGFWMFVLAIVVISWIGRGIFGNSSK